MEKPIREINFNPEESSFSNVQSLDSLFTDEDIEKGPEKIEDLFEEVKEVEDIRSEEEKQAEDLIKEVSTVNKESDLEEDEDGKEPKKPVFEDSVNYKELVKEFLGDTFDSIVIEEDGVEVEKSLDDLDLDKETFLDLIKSHVESIKEEAGKDKIAVSEISDLTKKIIEIDRNGGDILEALNIKKQYQDPFSNLDLTNKDDQKRAIIYGERLAGTSDEKIAKKLKFYEFDDSLEEEAYRLKEVAEEIANKKVQDLEKNAAEQREFEKKALEKYRGDLSESLDSFQLKPSFKKKLLDISSKKNEEGRFELDDLYSKVRANPSESADLIMFLANKEEYLKQKLAPELTKKQVETQKKLRFTRRSRGDMATKPSSTKADDFLDFADLPK